MVLADAIRSDYEVFFATGERYAHLVKTRDLEYRRVWTTPADIVTYRLAKGQDAWTPEDFYHHVQDDLATIKETRPDLVVGDLRLSLGISSEIAKVPYVSLINAHWSPYYTRIPPPPELPFVRILGVKLSTLLMPRFGPLILRKLAIPFNVARKKYGLSPVAEYRQVFTCATWVYYLDTPTLEPTRDAPANHKYLGPVFWSPDVSLPDWWGRLPTDRPVAYVAMGSTGKITFVTDIVDEIARMDMSVMLATSTRFDPKGLPRNVFAAEYLPGIDACKRSAFIVCNGGTGAIYQAICSGTPILGIPTNGDQYFAMGAAREQNAGLLVRSTHVTKRRIRNAVSWLMSDPKFAGACRRLQKEVSDYEAVGRFRRFVGALLQK